MFIILIALVFSRLSLLCKLDSITSESWLRLSNKEFSGKLCDEWSACRLRERVLNWFHSTPSESWSSAFVEANEKMLLTKLVMVFWTENSIIECLYYEILHCFLTKEYLYYGCTWRIRNAVLVYHFTVFIT